MSVSLPAPVPGLDADALLGRWTIAATTLSFWRGRCDASVTYERLADGAWSDTLRYRAVGSTKEKRLVGVDRAHPHGPGFFTWRGRGWLAWCSSTWGFVKVDPEMRWAVTWFSRATLGVTPEGMDLYVRERVSTGELASWLDAVRADASLPSLPGWFTIPER